jgi:hypothetical protein
MNKMQIINAEEIVHICLASDLKYKYLYDDQIVVTTLNQKTNLFNFFVTDAITINCSGNYVIDIHGQRLGADNSPNETFDPTFGAITIKENCYFHSSFDDVQAGGPMLYVDNATNYVWYKADSSINNSGNTPDMLGSNGTSVIYLDMPSEGNCNYTVGGYMRTERGKYCIEYVTGSGDKNLRILNSIFKSDPTGLAIFTPVGEIKQNITLAHSIGNTNQSLNIDIITHPGILDVYAFDLAIF